MPAGIAHAAFDRYQFEGFADARAQFDRAQTALGFRSVGLPAIEEHRDVLFVPAQGRLEGATGGLFSATGEPLTAALHRHGERTLFGDRATAAVDAVPPIPSRTIDHDVLYLGRGFHHFGHMLLEGLARAFAIREHAPDMPLLWHGITQFPTTRSSRRLLQGLGATPDRLLHVDQPVRLRRVLVPNPAIVYASLVHQGIAETYATIAERLGVTGQPTTDQPLYLSRAGLPNSERTVLEEERFEAALRRAGFATLRPETLDLREQIATVNRHRHVVGFRGTALRLTFFCAHQQDITSLHPTFPPASSLQNTLVTGDNERFVRAVSIHEAAARLRDLGFVSDPRQLPLDGVTTPDDSTPHRVEPPAHAEAPSDALAVDPWNLEARLQMATDCRHRGDYAEAAEHTKIAAQLHPLDPEIRELNRAMTAKAKRWARRPTIARLLRRR